MFVGSGRMERCWWEGCKPLGVVSYISCCSCSEKSQAEIFLLLFFSSFVFPLFKNQIPRLLVTHMSFLNFQILTVEKKLKLDAGENLLTHVSTHKWKPPSETHFVLSMYILHFHLPCLKISPQSSSMSPAFIFSGSLDFIYLWHLIQMYFCFDDVKLWTWRRRGAPSGEFTLM